MKVLTSLSLVLTLGASNSFSRETPSFETLTMRDFGIEGRKRSDYDYGENKQCYLIYQTRSQRTFSNWNDANNWCDDIHRNHNWSDRCFVRGFNNRNFEGDFRQLGYFVGEGNGWDDARNNVFNQFNSFLNDRRLFRSRFSFNFRFDNDCY